MDTTSSPPARRGDPRPGRLSRRSLLRLVPPALALPLAPPARDRPRTTEEAAPPVIWIGHV